MGRGNSAEAHESARERIHRVAARLYALRGFDGTSIREIAEGAGVTKPLVHYHFESKERLFGSLLAEALNRCETEAAEIMSRDVCAAEKLRSLLHVHATEAKDRPEIACFAHEVLTMAAHLPLDFDYKEQGRRVFANYTRVIAEGQSSGEFRADMDPRFAAAFAVATIGFFARAVLAGELDEIPEGFGDFVFDILLRGLEARAS